MPTAKTPELPLRDIHLPEPVSWWPLAPGWWLCLALLVMLTAAALWWWRGAPMRRLRRAALAELTLIEAAYARDGDGHACAQAVSRLLRRVALLAGDAEAAHSHGADMQALLTRLGKMPLPAEVIALTGAAPYSPSAAAAIEPAHYRAATLGLRTWLAQLRVPRQRLTTARHAAV
ncbi:MAG: DUF4381 domain-containing protein [Proteobacteria bacterium]|nr:DUF4381 domain-containing protein [Pseudomonadota bacterium]